jgi:hypothetical protein
VVIWIPEEAKVSAKPYMPERREYSPIASAPAALDTYALKLTLTVLMIKETVQRIRALNKNFRIFFMKPRENPFFFYHFMSQSVNKEDKIRQSLE